MSRLRDLGAWLATGLIAATSACTPARFADAPVVWRSADRQTIAEPDSIPYVRPYHYGEIYLWRPVERTLSLPDGQEAGDINALDELPSSTWFENRIGLYDLSPQDVARGRGLSPPELPFEVVSGKEKGAQPGFIAEDRSGRRFLVKFDLEGRPEKQSATAAIVSRLFWALGYHVPSEHVAVINPARLHFAEDATFETTLGETYKLTREYFTEQLLSRAARRDDGRYRVLASQMLEGKPKGGFPDRGLRRDDANDRVPHQHRRSLRALQVFCAWLGHTDFNPENTLDMYVTEEGRSFLRHHLVDFGQALGVHDLNSPWVGYMHMVDLPWQLGAYFSFGLWVKPWEGEPEPPFRGTGRYFPMDPRDWDEAKPYAAFEELTAADAFWAAKNVLRFQRDHVEAAVETGQLTDPRARRYLVDTIMTRRRQVGMAYVAPVTALDRFSVEGDRLCATDLAVLHGLSDGLVAERLVDGEVTEREPIDGDARVCFAGPGERRYVVYSLRTRRGDEEHDEVEVHVRGGREPTVIGIRRDW